MNLEYQKSSTQNPLLKVCGLTQLNQIQELISLKVDFLGFIFYQKSPRFVLQHLSLEEIQGIPFQNKVGVFVNESVSNVADIAKKVGLKYIQLHGDENLDFIVELKKKLEIDVKLIKVIRIGNQSIDNLQNTINKENFDVDCFLFDTDSKAFGGTGKTFDWDILNQIEIPKPYFLSGGISLENIRNVNLIKQKPWVLDINSKFEVKPGDKDIDKIKKITK